jgi:dynactin 1
MLAKIRVLEAKRADDAQHIRELETRLADAESFVALRPKLQAKLQSLQTELIATKRALADAEQLTSLGETRGADAQEQLEMAMLDKEVAEEKAELAEQELEEVKERLAHVEVELGVLKEGGGENNVLGFVLVFTFFYSVWWRGRFKRPCITCIYST